MPKWILKYRFFLMAGAMIPIILFLAGRLIQSPAEQVAASIKIMAGLVEREDLAELGDYIASSYDGEVESDKKTLLAGAEIYFDEVKNTRIKIKDVLVNVSGEQAEAMVIYEFSTTMINAADVYSNVPVYALYENGPTPERSYLRLIKTDDKWKVEYLVMQGAEFADRFPEAKKYFSN